VSLNRTSLPDWHATPPAHAQAVRTAPRGQAPSRHAGTPVWTCLALVLCAGLGLSPRAALAQDQPATPAPAPAPAPSAPATAAPVPAPEAEEPSNLNLPDTNPYEGRLVREVRFEGLKRVEERLLLNQVRTVTGRPLVWNIVKEDMRRLERLGEFRDIQADLLVDDELNVVVVFKLVEATIVSSVDIVGNRQISDEDVRATVAGNISLIAGIPVDDFQIGRAQRAIEELYRNKGYYLAQVTVDESELVEGGTIIFRVREGERTKVTAIRFEGNESLPARLLSSEIKTKKSGLFETGPIDDGVLDSDVAAIIKMYLDRGYLDVRASRRVQPSPNGKEAIITFLIEEGPVYTLRNVSVRLAGTGNEDTPAREPTILSREQIMGLMLLKPGDAFSQKVLDDSVKAVRDAYRQMGYVDAGANAQERRDPDQPVVDLEIVVAEGERYKTGMVYIQGNDLTQHKVVRRRVQNQPDRWLDGAAAEDTERRLQQSGLFAPQRSQVTIQPEDPAQPGYRDVLVEVEETNTGSLGFGVAVGSDAGVVGAITLTQRNFDIADTPDSFDEFIRGRAFRGAGQSFNLSIQPGTEQSNYSLGLSEPNIFETDYSLGSSIYFRQREFDEYDEDRLGVRGRLARRFGERWSGGISARGEALDISDVSSTAAVDLQEVEGDSIITGIGPDLIRSTIDNRFRPSKGTYTELGAEFVGAIGGDYNFTKLNAEHQVFIAIDEDVLGNKTVLSFKGRVGYIPEEDEAPIFERYYLGGRSFRGFRFRGIGPLGLRADGTQTDDHVGGQWSFFLGTELERPIFKDVVSGVVFIDSGTLTEDISFEDYRVSVGTGIRLYVPALGQAPLAFDFAFPLQSEEGDQERLFSFSLDIPIQ